MFSMQSKWHTRLSFVNKVLELWTEILQMLKQNQDAFA